MTKPCEGCATVGSFNCSEHGFEAALRLRDETRSPRTLGQTKYGDKLREPQPPRPANDEQHVVVKNDLPALGEVAPSRSDENSAESSWDLPPLD